MPVAVLAAAFLFNLGQGVLRPSMPLYLQRTFAANYRMVTLIPFVFGAGKWIANMPTGYLLSRFGRPLMVGGLGLIAFIDVVGVTTARFDVFLGWRALGGVGWAMFATVATTVGAASPFLFEAACMVVAAITVGHWASLAADATGAAGGRDS